MALGGTAPPRGSAAAAASLKRRRTISGGSSGGAAGTMLQFYTDDAPEFKISPNVVLSNEHWLHCICCRPSCDGQALLCAKGGIRINDK